MGEHLGGGLQLADADAWRDLAPSGSSPQGEGRPTLAYDSDQDIVLCLHNGQTYVYTVKSNVWKKLDVDPPGKAAECMVYDTRHKVFLATHNMGEHMWVFRYRGGGD